MQLIGLAPALSASRRFAPAGCFVVLVFVYISLNEVRPCIGYRSSIDFAGNLPRIAVMLALDPGLVFDRCLGPCPARLDFPAKYPQR